MENTGPHNSCYWGIGVGIVAAEKLRCASDVVRRSILAPKAIAFVAAVDDDDDRFHKNFTISV